MLKKQQMPKRKPPCRVVFFLARKEGFELEEAISCGGKCHRFRFFRSFCWYIIAFRAPLYIRLKGENKGENWAGYRLQPPVAAEIRRTPGGAAAFWVSWRPPSAAEGDGGQTHTRLRCRVLGVLEAAFCCQGRREGQAHARRCCRVLGVLKAIFSRTRGTAQARGVGIVLDPRE